MSKASITIFLAGSVTIAGTAAALIGSTCILETGIGAAGVTGFFGFGGVNQNDTDQCSRRNGVRRYCFGLWHFQLAENA